jgi:hypothetical protein
MQHLPHTYKHIRSSVLCASAQLVLNCVFEGFEVFKVYFLMFYYLFLAIVGNPKNFTLGKRLTFTFSVVSRKTDMHKLIVAREFNVCLF